MQSWRVYDADTLMDMTLDLGFGVSIVVTGRLFGIDAPELRGAERTRGLLARDWLRARLQVANDVRVETQPVDEKQQGKYGRWLVTIWADNENLNQSLVKHGYARPAYY